MASLNAFLHPVKSGNKEVYISDRFQENGKPVPFVIRPITESENKALIRKHSKKDKKGNESFDQVAYAHELTAAAVVEPPLDNTELQKRYGVLGASNLLAEMLLIGEFNALAEEVQGLSGIDKDINEEIEEAKNS